VICNELSAKTREKWKAPAINNFIYIGIICRACNGSREIGSQKQYRSFSNKKADFFGLLIKNRT
jgi:hypothetical protein